MKLHSGPLLMHQLDGEGKGENLTSEKLCNQFVADLMKGETEDFFSMSGQMLAFILGR